MNKKISLRTHQQIQRHPNNSSPAKISFRFSKSKRFKQSNPECPVIFYTYTTQLSKKKASICSSKKSDFTKDQRVIPSASNYNPDNYHQFVKNRGKSFGSSRQKSKDRSYLIPQIHTHPGVGAYQTEKPKINNSYYSIRSKTIDPNFHYLTNKQAPGPGKYQAPNLNVRNLSYLVSKFKKAPLGCCFTSPRFKEIKNGPGPSTYRDSDNLSPNNRYVNSKYKGEGNRPFTQQKRFSHEFWKPSANPGPGQYEQTSDFGLYGPKTFKAQPFKKQI